MTNVAVQLQDHLGVQDALFNKNLKGGANWDEFANGLEIDIRNQIANSSQMCAESHQLVVSEGLDNPEFLALCNGIMRDLQTFADRLMVQISKRNNRTGPTKNASDYTDYFSIGMELTSLAEDIQVVVAHSLIGVTEYTHQAMEKIKQREEQKAAESAATDPTVVTDVEPK